MGKLTSMIIGFIAICAITFYYLSTSYTGLIDWLGPVFGPQIIYATGFLLLFFGNPLNYPAVLFSWIGIGVLVAAGSRKGLRSAGAAISLFFLSLSFFGTVAASLILPLVSGGSTSLTSLTTLPPPPPGVSLVALTSAPVISGILAILESFLSGLGLQNLVPITAAAFSPSLSVPVQTGGIPYLKIVDYMIYPMVENIVILALTAGIVGYLFGIPGRKREKPVEVPATAVVVALALLLLAGLAVSGAVNAPHVHANVSRYNGMNAGNQALKVSAGIMNYYTPPAVNGMNDPYYEALASYVTQMGSVYNFYAYADAYNGSTESSPFISSPGVSASAFTFLMASSGLQDFSYGGIGNVNLSVLRSIGSGSLLNLLPGVILVSVYKGSLNSSSSLMNSEVNSVESSLNIRLSEMLSYGVSVSGVQEYSIYAYGSQTGLSGISGNYLKYAVNGFSGGGLIDVFKSGISSGALIPGSVAGNVDGSVLFSAYLNSSAVSFSGSVGNIVGSVSSGSSKMALTGGFTVRNHAYHSSSDQHSISLAGTLGYSGTMHFSNSSSGSLVLLGVPSVVNGTGQSTVPENFTGYARNANLLGMLPFGVSNVTELNYSSASGISPSTVTSLSNWTYPRHLEVNVSMKDLSSGQIRVETTITNRDNVTVNGITLDESNFSRSYSSGIRNMSGSTVMKIASLAPGSSRVLSFSFYPEGVGNYTVPSVSVSYSEYISSTGRNVQVNDTFSGSSIHITSGNFAVVANHVEYVSLSTMGSYIPFFGYFSYAIFPGFYLFDLILVLVVVADVLLERRSYRKARKK